MMFNYLENPFKGTIELEQCCKQNWLNSKGSWFGLKNIYLN